MRTGTLRRIVKGRCRVGLVVLATVALGPGRAAADAMVGAVDDFEGSHTWVGHEEEVVIPDPCTCPPPFPACCVGPTMTTLEGVSEQPGGPGGPADTFLQVTALPSFGIETWNVAEDRTGDFLAAGIGAIEVQLSNRAQPPSETGTLVVRVGIDSGSTTWVTSDAHAVSLPDPVSPNWSQHSFHLVGAQMTRVAGSAALSSALQAVDRITILHADSAQASGDSGPNLGIDDVTLPEPGAGPALALGALLVAGLARRRSRRGDEPTRE